jgi:hypothetical protein
MRESIWNSDMSTEELSCCSGARHARPLKRGSMLVALRGRLRLTCRDAALHWLSGAAPALTIVLDEGEAHTFTDDTYVEWTADSGWAVSGVIDAPPPWWKTLLAGRIGRRGPARWPGAVPARGARDSLG